MEAKAKERRRKIEATLASIEFQNEKVEAGNAACLTALKATSPALPESTFSSPNPTDPMRDRRTLKSELDTVSSPTHMRVGAGCVIIRSLT